MARVKTLAAGTTLFPADVDQMEDEIEYAFSIYKTILRRSAQWNTGSATQMLATNAHVNEGAQTGATTADTYFYLDPADRAVAGRTVNYRVRFELQTGSATPVGASATVALMRVVTWATTTAPSHTAQSTVASVAVATPAVNSQYVVNSAEFTLPTAGFYYFQLIGGSGGFNTADASAELQYRQV